MIESDVTSVINHIRGIDKFWCIETIIENGLWLASSICHLSWRGIPRIANQSTNWIMKQSLVGMCHHDWVLQPPPLLSVLINKDYDMYLGYIAIS